jgi:hypothetical protein
MGGTFWEPVLTDVYKCIQHHTLLKDTFFDIDKSYEDVASHTCKQAGLLALSLR